MKLTIIVRFDKRTKIPSELSVLIKVATLISREFPGGILGTHKSYNEMILLLSKGD